MELAFHKFFGIQFSTEYVEHNILLEFGIPFIDEFILKPDFLQNSTDCPGAFDPFLEGYYSAMGRATGQVVVYSGRGRFKVFFEVWWTHLS